MSDVAHGVPVLSPHGGRVGTAIVAEGHVEIVWDDKQLGKELLDRIKYMHVTSLVLYGTGDAAVPLDEEPLLNKIRERRRRDGQPITGGPAQ